MMEGAAPAIPAEVINYLRIWAQGMAQVLGQIAGKTFKIECLLTSPADWAPAAETDLWIIVACSGALRGEMSLRMGRSDAQCLAQLLMGEALDARAEFNTEMLGAVPELLGQVAGHIATALKAGSGEVQIRLEPGGPPSWPAAATAWLAATANAASNLRMEVQLSAALAAALRPVGPGTAEPALATKPLPDQLNRLMGVELAVSLRFGCRRMLLREVLELNAGAVVELDRKLKEPVDLLVDGRLIARGEVVVVDGNYGLRVTSLVFDAAG